VEEITLDMIYTCNADAKAAADALAAVGLAMLALRTEELVPRFMTIKEFLNEVLFLLNADYGMARISVGTEEWFLVTGEGRTRKSQRSGPCRARTGRHDPAFPWRRYQSVN
jgi:hypothetical protein